MTGEAWVTVLVLLLGALVVVWSYRRSKRTGHRADCPLADRGMMVSGHECEYCRRRGGP